MIIHPINLAFQVFRSNFSAKIHAKHCLQCCWHSLRQSLYFIYLTWRVIHSYWNSELRSSDVSWTSSMTFPTFVWTRRSEQIKSIQMMLPAKIWTILIYKELKLLHQPSHTIWLWVMSNTRTLFQYSDKMRMTITSKLANNNDTPFNCKDAALQVL